MWVTFDRVVISLQAQPGSMRLKYEVLTREVEYPGPVSVGLRIQQRNVPSAASIGRERSYEIDEPARSSDIARQAVFRAFEVRHSSLIDFSL